MNKIVRVVIVILFLQIIWIYIKPVSAEIHRCQPKLNYLAFQLDRPCRLALSLNSV